MARRDDVRREISYSGIPHGHVTLLSNDGSLIICNTRPKGLRINRFPELGQRGAFGLARPRTVDAASSRRCNAAEWEGSSF